MLIINPLIIEDELTEVLCPDFAFCIPQPLLPWQHTLQPSPPLHNPVPPDLRLDTQCSAPSPQCPLSWGPATFLCEVAPCRGPRLASPFLAILPPYPIYSHVCRSLTLTPPLSGSWVGSSLIAMMIG